MSQGNDSGRPRPALGRSTPLLAVLLLLLAGWFGWSAVEQWMQSGTSAGLEQSRDQAVADVQTALSAQTTQFARQLALEPVKAALASGDAAAAALAWSSSNTEEKACNTPISTSTGTNVC